MLLTFPGLRCKFGSHSLAQELIYAELDSQLLTYLDISRRHHPEAIDLIDRSIFIYAPECVLRLALEIRKRDTAFYLGNPLANLTCTCRRNPDKDWTVAGLADELQWAGVRGNDAASAIKEDFDVTRKWFEVGDMDVADLAENQGAFKGMFLTWRRREEGEGEKRVDLRCCSIEWAATI
jgi:hypothetical protein